MTEAHGTDTQAPAATAHADAADPYIWLEDVHGARPLAWVEAENARSLAVLKGDPRYATLHEDALKIVNATDRIPMPEQIGGAVFNFWQDPTHVRGIWRRTTPQSYATATPSWETVIDLDALATAEKKNWVWKGANCPPPDYRRCLVGLSDGGEDADTLRELDLKSGSFVDGGFVLPRSKQNVDWLDADTLILARDWGPGTMTASSYPFVVKTLKRGQSLDQATEVFRGKPDDVAVSPIVLHDGEGHKLVLIVRALDFFHQETYELTDRGVAQLQLPAKVDIKGLVGGQLVFMPLEDWRGYKAGALVAFAPADLRERTDAPGGPAHLLFAPGPRQSVEQVAIAKDRVVAAIYDNVRGGLFTFRLQNSAWTRAPIPVAANSSVGVASASEASDQAYYTVENFLAPTHLWHVDLASGEATDIKDMPARFDASGDAVDQYEATSSDGTKIPYFVVHPKGMKLDGSNPTILYAYGGFQVSMLPSYGAATGKLWLEHGGVYVLANIRGGGEFGPAWHEAGLKTHRQLVYDDFAAVAKDLIARKITSPRRLGIQGGSNGGLLMGVEFVQHPELWRAVDIEVPLLDMLRIDKLGAGASWAGEYGDLSDPAVRAFWEKTSPYQNLKAGVAYPEPFFVTATSDDRVTPVHARKMAARMQEMGLPYLFFENTNGGHSASANLQERAERVALEFTYFTRKLMD
ncbi:MAG TPA: prolyl oligopeptidase family serine peptidase [Caulobacteraceae bacterium]|nr:prolyl oligopeptidase family serine peptidase [Caulobacteraceae bacterium]